MEYFLQHLARVPSELWNVLAQMAPWLLLGFLVAGVLSILLPQSVVERHLSGRGFWPVLKAALLGVPLPLCSCGVIPVSASLRKHGASRGATIAFLISTPQTGADNIAVIYSLLGPVVAVFSPIAALLTGLLGGTLVDAAEGPNHEPAEAPAPCIDDSCKPKERALSRILGVLHYGFITLPRDIAKPLLVGLLIAGSLAAFVPTDFFAASLGTGVLSMLLMLLISIPLYVCSTASVPIAAAFIGMGLSPGAALVFLIAGPSTNAATISTIWKVLGRRTALIYLGTIAGGALLSGMLLNNLIRATHTAELCRTCVEQPGIWHTLSAVALLALLALALFPNRPRLTEDRTMQPDETQAKLKISGMTCGHCVESVRRALAGIAGVVSAVVELGSGTATVTGKQFEIPALVAAVEAAGYSAKPIDA